jgi:hypothetical protein
MSLIFADRINDDLSNEVDVVSDMDIQARRFMSFIKRGMNQTPDLYEKMDIVLPTNAVPFQERFNDFVGGVALDCNFVVFTDINACDYYEPEPSPTPSNTASVTPTPTITPTNTTTPTNTPTITPTQTLGECFIFDLIGASPGITTFGYLDCYGVSQTQLVNFNDTISVCAKQYSVTYNNAGIGLNTFVPC